MKTTLFHFSGTGNSLQVARDLARELGDAELTAIPTALQRAVTLDADRVGLVFPVYAFGMPGIVTEFCRKLPAAATYVFGVATCGGVPGATLLQLRDVLKERGLKLSAGFVLRMPGNYTPLRGAIPEKAQQKMFAQEKDRLRKIAEVVKAGAESRIEASHFLVNLAFSTFLYRKAISSFGASDRSFRVKDSCTSCRTCHRVCPVANIEMREGRPAWLHHCEQCMACLQWCPVEAIEFGRVTEGRRRYHHPAVSARDLTWRD